MRAADHWASEARRWATWARAPGHDAYWYYRDAFFGLLPAAGRRALEVGCGEGRVARDLAARGHRVTAIDISPPLLSLAAQADSASRYVIADGAALPFHAAAFDLVVAYNCLMDVDDMPGVIREMGRVLEPGGHLCACVTHPLWDAGRFATSEPNAPFVVEGAYLRKRRYEATFERGGLNVTFRGWCYPLAEYARALEDAGFRIEALREPVPDAAAPPSWERNHRIPVFLMLRAVKSTADGRLVSQDPSPTAPSQPGSHRPGGGTPQACRSRSGRTP